MQIPEGYIMISLDVVSLFTNVPRDLVRKNIIERWREVDTNINLDMFLEIVELCMESSYFCYEGQFFMQTYGTAMGSPLSPILADIVLDSVINRALSTLPFESPIFKKYVDDIFMVIPQQTIQLVLEAFNRIEPRLQFTVEVEKEGKLPFLDMTVIRKDSQELTTEWYAKPIASGRMLNYHSFHQPRYKMNVANNFIHSVHKLTHNKSEEEIAATIRDHLRRNNYPKQLVNRLLNLYKAKRFSTPSSTPADQPSSLRLPTASPPRLPPPAPPPTATSSAAPPPPTIPSCQPSCQLPMTPQDNTSSRPFCQQTSPPPTNDYQSSHNTQQEAIEHGERSMNQQINITNQQSRYVQSSISTTQSGSANPSTINVQPTAPPDQKMYRSIPYIPSLSERISKILKKDYPNVVIATRQIRTIKTIHTKVKFPTSKEDKSNIIYKIPCNNCESCYIGMTKNSLRKRLAGHKSNINKLEKMLNENHTNTALTALAETTTALIKHCIQSQHKFDLDRTEIIDHSNKTTTLPFLEMCHITNTNHTVNKRTDVEGLNTTYAALLHSIKNHYEHNKHDRIRPE
ncbi:uncharacterized protein LOC134288912 [Aedes albopictus]|uniref:Reverse transcriptase domain-containing protein n=1 Tax=Aedes albopictus TaxID=7160 RepID=A0ABM1ZPL6_AEDAL